MSERKDERIIPKANVQTNGGDGRIPPESRQSPRYWLWLVECIALCALLVLIVSHNPELLQQVGWGPIDFVELEQQSSAASGS